MRKSTVTTLTDSAGDYEQEVFVCDNPKRIIIGVHGNGVRRWDGEEFFYQVAEHFADSVVMLVDQNQVEGDGCKLNSIEIAVRRNQKLISDSKKNYPDLPIWVLGHSMGCGISSLLDTNGLSGIIFVAPGVGNIQKIYSERYGEDIVNGKVVKTSDGLVKNISIEFMNSAKDIVWQNKHKQLLSRYSPVHVFESGDDEIVGEGRFELRDMPFASYTIIDGAKHNFSGKYSEELFSKIDLLIH